MSKEIENKVFELFSNIMSVPIKSLSKESNPNTIENWDSLSHVKIIMQIEHNFKLDLLPDEAMEIFSIGDAIKIILSKTN